MKRTIVKTALHSTLCLVLSPLLCAQEMVPSAATVAAQSSATTQQVAPEASATGMITQSPSYPAIDPVPEKLLVPVNTSVELYLLDRVSSATARVGMPVRFAVGKSFVFGGVTLLKEGTVVTGKVTQVRHGVASKDHARLEIKLDNVALGKGMDLTLTEQWIESRSEKIDNIGFAVFAAPFVALFSPFLLAEKIAESRENRPTGEEIVQAACTSKTYHTASEVMVTTAGLEPAGAGTHVDLENLCPEVHKERQKARCAAALAQGPSSTETDALCQAPKATETPSTPEAEPFPAPALSAFAVAQAH